MIGLLIIRIVAVPLYLFEYDVEDSFVFAFIYTLKSLDNSGSGLPFASNPFTKTFEIVVDLYFVEPVRNCPIKGINHTKDFA